MKIRISYILNVLNGEPFIKYQLKSIYRFAHEIIIVEGAYEKYSHAANQNGSSVDNTVSIIQNFPDPADKIIFIQNNNKLWPERKEMCNAVFNYVTGNVIWQIDVDEFYHNWVHEYIYKLFDEDDQLDKISFYTREFFMSPYYEIKGAYETLDLVNVGRVFRYNQGEEWLNQRPPILGLNRVPKTIRKELSGYQVSRKAIFMYNYAGLFKNQVYDKIKYHNMRNERLIVNPTNIIQNMWNDLSITINPAFLETIPSYLERVKPQDIPSIIITMWDELDNEERDLLQKRNNKDIEKYLDSKDYKRDKKVVLYFNNLYKTVLNNKIFFFPIGLCKYLVYFIFFYKTNRPENLKYLKNVNNKLFVSLIKNYIQKLKKILMKLNFHEDNK